jgi:hypothetical protein
MDGKPPNVLIPCILRVVLARVINERGFEEQTAGASIGAERKDVRPSNTKRSTVSISIDVGQVEERMLLVHIKALNLVCNDSF